VFGPSTPNDYYYNMSNNTSIGGAGYTKLNTWPIPDAAHRVSESGISLGTYLSGKSHTRKPQRIQ
jgi:hypothetical protein